MKVFIHQVLLLRGLYKLSLLYLPGITQSAIAKEPEVQKRNARQCGSKLFSSLMPSAIRTRVIHSYASLVHSHNSNTCRKCIVFSTSYVLLCIGAIAVQDSCKGDIEGKQRNVCKLCRAYTANGRNSSPQKFS